MASPTTPAAPPTPPPPVVYRPRRSFAGPVVLIVFGVLFLLGNLGYVSWGRLGYLFSRYWPVLIILWGLVKLAEHFDAQRQGYRPRGIGFGGGKRPVMQMGQGTCRRALAERRIFRRPHIVARLIGRLHVRRDDAKRAGIQDAGHFGDTRHTHERRDAGLHCGHADLPGGFEREACMLKIHIKTVETGRGGNAGDLGPAHQPHDHRGDERK